jgi:hypothetical protein
MTAMKMMKSLLPRCQTLKEHDVDTYDQYVGAHVRVPIGDEILSGKVVRLKRELDGTVRGRASTVRGRANANLM